MSRANPVTKSTYRPELDSLRAIAITMVMLHHYLTVHLPFAGYGVAMFFVLSGYFGTRSLIGLRAHAGGPDFSHRQAAGIFYARRYLRIFPPHLLLLAVTAILAVPDARETLGWNLLFTSNIGMMVEGDWFGRFSPLWSLSLLEQFYLIWPALILLMPKRWLAHTALAAILVSVLYLLTIWQFQASAFWWFMPLPAGLDSLGAGALLAVWRHDAEQNSRQLRLLRRLGLWLGGPAVALFILSKMWHFQMPVQDLYSPVLISLFFVWVIDRTLDGIGGPLGALLRIRWLAAAGQVSYAAFLFHNFTELLLLPIPGLAPLLETNWGALILVPATFVLAHLSWVLLERPISDYRKSKFRAPTAKDRGT